MKRRGALRGIVESRSMQIMFLQPATLRSEIAASNRSFRSEPCLHA
jgi:hypothetical protein